VVGARVRAIRQKLADSAPPVGGESAFIDASAALPTRQGWLLS
jgi:hypothetical protein